MTFFEYVNANWSLIAGLFLDHIKYTAIAVSVAALIGVPLGIFISANRTVGKPILSLANVIQAIPSMALLGFMIPFLGIGEVPAIVAVVMYALLPIIKNSYIGIANINPQTIEAARGIGLTKWQVLSKIEIPLALPVIMGGVRIASVTAVGLMTMAAYIGAGGLGFLVFSGIRTVNTNQILAGAIPACILALSVDFVIGQIEKLVTPIALQPGDTATKKKNRAYQKAIVGVVAACLVCVFTVSFINAETIEGRSITIGSKDYTEQAILANMVAELIEENTDITVIRKTNLGGTNVCFGALQTGDLDMYVEYSGTAYASILGYSPITDMQLVYDTVNEDIEALYDIEVLSQMNFNNTYAICVTQETADEYNLTTISDLAKVGSQLISGTTFEFTNREDGLIGLQSHYNFTFKESLSLEGYPLYQAVDYGDVDVISAFATDGLLKKYELVTLEDDQSFFLPYCAIPFVTTETLEECPEIEALLDELAPYLTNDVMSELNYRVDELQENPDAVAADFLRSIELIY